MTPLMLTLLAGPAHAEAPPCDPTRTIVAVVPLDACQVDGVDGFLGEAHVLVTSLQYDPGAEACVESDQHVEVYQSAACIQAHIWPELEWLLPVPDDEDHPANEVWKRFKDIWEW